MSDDKIVKEFNKALDEYIRSCSSKEISSKEAATELTKKNVELQEQVESLKKEKEEQDKNVKQLKEELNTLTLNNQSLLEKSKFKDETNEELQKKKGELELLLSTCDKTAEENNKLREQIKKLKNALIGAMKQLDPKKYENLKEVDGSQIIVKFSDGGYKKRKVNKKSVRKRSKSKKRSIRKRR